MKNSFIARASSVVQADAKSTLQNRIKKIREDLAKYKDWNTTGSHDKRLADLRKQLAEAREKLKGM